MAECGACLLPGMRPPADPQQSPSEIECFELVGLDLMIETETKTKTEAEAEAETETETETETERPPASGSPRVRVWLLELNSFPAAAPFHQAHGKSATFHREQVGFCASLLSMVLGSSGQVRSPKLTVAFSQSSYILTTYRVAGTSCWAVRLGAPKRSRNGELWLTHRDNNTPRGDEKV